MISSDIRLQILKIANTTPSCHLCLGGIRIPLRWPKSEELKKIRPLGPVCRQRERFAVYQEAKRLSMNSGFDLNKKREAAERAEGRKGLFVGYASISLAPFSQSDPPTLLSSYGLNCATFLSPNFFSAVAAKEVTDIFCGTTGRISLRIPLRHEAVLTATGAIKSARPLSGQVEDDRARQPIHTDPPSKRHIRR